MMRRDPRIAAIDNDDGVLIVSLAPGYAFQDAGTPNACHTFGADDMAEVRSMLKARVTRCNCYQCANDR